MEPTSVKISSISSNTNQSVLHSIPCKIDYTGPADIDGYFMVEKENDTCKASFRGHSLEGKNISMPEGYNLFILKQSARNAASSTPSYDITSKRSELLLWEWDKEPGPRSTMVRALEFLPLAQRLSSD
ncbi:unnamed protein product [Auanema sp. JU1783]|nr:unnamed protein product [Auanema sp. JU1783]